MQELRARARRGEQLRRGQPFHAGTAWQVMDVGLRGMAGVLAD